MHIYLFFLIQSIYPSLPHQTHKRRLNPSRIAIKLPEMARAKKIISQHVKKRLPFLGSGVEAAAFPGPKGQREEKK